MTSPNGWVCMDGNEATARVAHRLSEVIAIYPITPATPMGELADIWSAVGQPNLWGQVPRVLELQSEAGAAGTLHGALLKGALATTFTASQGLLLMLPNMFKIAGELTPAVIHVAARTVATHALSIFGDHSDVMAARPTGWAMLASGSVQEAHDLALVAHAATLASRVPFLHFFDGFRTSHEVAKIRTLTDEDLAAVVDLDAVRAHRERGLSPDRPRLRGSAQNPDVFFQAREAANPFYAAVPEIVQAAMDRLAERTGRRYGLVDYQGDPEADRVVVLMGSSAGAAAEAVEALNAAGERVGLVTVRLYRPFPAAALVAAVPETVRRVAVLDRTKEPGATGEPLYQDVVTALAEHAAATGTAPPLVAGGRYGLASKEFTPAMAKAVLDGLAGGRPRNHFTVGIADDVSHTSLTVDGSFQTEDTDGLRAVFYGLGSDGTVSANKTAVKIIGEGTDLFAQGYFVYDSKKSGSVTVSHLRISARSIRSSYLIDQANFVACHQFGFLERMDVLERAAPGATFLLNSPWPADQVWDHLPVEVQRQIIDRRLDLWVVDAARVAREAGLGHRINTVMQPCFFALAGVLPREQAIAAIKRWVDKAFSRRGEEVVARNFAAIDHALTALARVEVPATVTGDRHRRPAVPAEAPEFVQRVTARMLEGRGDLLPVSALPVDGAFPTGTARWEKRSLAAEIPIWDPSICIDCGKCAIVCPHATIRMKVFGPEALDEAPASFLSKEFRSRDLPGQRLTIQVAPDDCTGCGVCVEVCPAHAKGEVKHKAINMTPIDAYLERERENWDYFLGIPEIAPDALAPDSVKGSQVRQPLFEFSGACAGCGETPYLNLISQLFGDRLLVANATGCSSIYGGNLPTTPWATNPEGRGPAWANSLFEDNAEFGLGIRLAAESLNQRARQLVERLERDLGADLVAAILEAPRDGEAAVAAQRERVAELRRRLASLDLPEARELEGIADELVRRSVWIVGGDGWAYDIGSAGLDAVLASGEDVNLLVLDTEVYSNTGGQASKASPRGAVAKFAARGKQTGKKDLGLLAMSYGNVYVAHVAMGASDMQTVKALLEAEAWPGPSLVIAYSTCIAHGFDMSASMAHQRDAARSGHWPLYRYHPDAERPFQLDSKPPTVPLRQFAQSEARFAMLARTDPGEFDQLMTIAEEDARERWRYYEQLATLPRTAPHLPPRPGRAAGHAEQEEDTQ
ncbi:MAG TPA: pyruvate:ferredoxin (flavodoxin) oxidoreductase [Actinomycetes bacterium]|nr:pyruvate:ferredoxin (flavodoxin) oxidoreductase [Actinomycetes bacterium]